jgi:hypothetical protein
MRERREAAEKNIASDGWRGVKIDFVKEIDAESE